MKTTICSLAVAMLAAGGVLPAAGVAAASFEFGGFEYDSERYVQWRLPRSLREISGLAVDERQRLFAHDDERAVVHQIDYDNGRVVKRFALGNPPVSDDFEGIAVREGFVYLVSSGGTLYRAREGSDGAAVEYDVIYTGLGAQCEVEGLAFAAGDEALWFACKRVRGDNPALLRWWRRERRVEGFAPALATGLSGVAISPRNGHLLLVAARRQRLVEVDTAGRIVVELRLPQARHGQTEGIALLEDGRLILADEGSETGSLSVYRPQ